jgi:peptidoglycan hydrolase CwlO-like protein
MLLNTIPPTCRRRALSPSVLILAVAVVVTGSTFRLEAQCQPFVRGDTNADGELGLSDAVTILGFAFLGDEAPSCMKATDINSNGTAAEISDAIYLLSFSFLGGSAPAGPFPDCGVEAGDSNLSCLVYAPCSGFICPGEAVDEEAALELIESEFVDPASPVVELSTLELVVGETLEVAVGESGLTTPWLEWGDGDWQPVPESGQLSHVYKSFGEKTVWLADASGEVYDAQTVFVVPALSILDIHIDAFPADGMGGGGNNIAPRGGAGQGQNNPFDPNQQGEQNPPGGQNQPSFHVDIPDPVRQIPAGQPGPVLGVQILTEGTGVLSVKITVEMADGNRIVLGESSQSHDSSAPFGIEVGPLPTQVVGVTRVWVNVETQSGASRMSVPFSYQTLQLNLTPAQQNDPCWQIRIFHQVLVGLKKIKKDDCERIRRALEQLEGELSQARFDLTAANAALDAADAARSQLQEEYNKLESQIQNMLGSAGTLKSRDQLSSGEQFVGNGGIGVAFTSASALLSQSSAFSPSILASVNKLGQLSKKITQAGKNYTQAEAKVAGLEAKIADLEAQIADLEAQLEACERECHELETEIEDVEELEKECLRIQKIIRETQDAIDDAGSDAHGAGQDVDGFDSDAEGTRGQSGSSPGTDADREDDEEGIQEAESVAAGGKTKLEDALRKLQDARNALAAGDFDRAAALTAEAHECIKEAKATIATAQGMLDDVGESIEGRECTSGEKQELEWVPYTLSVSLGYSLVPTGQTPDSWEEIKNKAESRVAAVQGFLEFVDWVSTPVEKLVEVVTLGLVKNPFEIDAGEIAEKLVGAYRELFKGQLGIDVYVHLGAQKVEQRIVKECIGGKWVTGTEVRMIGEPVPTPPAVKVGEVLLKDEDDRREAVDKLLENHEKNLRAGWYTTLSR